MKKKIFTILALSLIGMISLFSLAVAYFGGVKGLGLIGVWFFMTFGVVVVLAQVIPAVLIVYSVFKALSSSGRQEEPIPAV